MQIIFRTPPVPGVVAHAPNNGPSITGYAYFVAKAYAPGEIPAEGELPRTVQAWRADSFARKDGSIEVPAGSMIEGSVVVPPAVVPSAVLDALPPGTLVTFRWAVSVGVPK